MAHTITLPISKKVVTVKEVMTTKQVRRTRTELKDIIDLANSVGDKQPTQEQIAVLTNKTVAQDELVAEILLDRTDLTQDVLDNIPYMDAAHAFNQLYKFSLEPPKN